jgi:large subunit ribosomal protein L9
MDRAIKALGLTETRIRLHPEVSVSVIVNIARSLAEAETQLKTGIAVTGEVNDEVDDAPAEQQASHAEANAADADAAATSDDAASDAENAGDAADGDQS